MKSINTSWLAVLVLPVIVMSLSNAYAHGQKHEHSNGTMVMTPTPDEKNAGWATKDKSDSQIPDINILDQFGKQRQFYSDLIEDRIVAINFVFTNCELSCPLMGFKFGLLRKLLAESNSTPIELVSVTTDSPYDTPERLRSWAEKFNAGPGWTQVTGQKQQVDSLLKSLDAFSADKTEHSTLVLLVNDRTQQRKWIDGNSDPGTILSALHTW